MTSTVIAILTISFLATLVRSTLGFGESLIAVPLLLLFLPVDVAVPLSVMLSMLIALIVVAQDHSKIHFQSAKWLVLSAVPGIPIGLAVLIYGNETVVKITLGLLIILYALYSMFSRRSLTRRVDHPLWLFACGFVSGVLGGAYGLNGPPLVVYGNSRKWSAVHFRATLQAYFLLASSLGFAGYLAKGLVTNEVIHYFLWSLASVIPAVFIGRYLNQQLNDEAFFNYAYRALVVVGVILILNTLV